MAGITRPLIFPFSLSNSIFRSIDKKSVLHPMKKSIQPFGLQDNHLPFSGLTKPFSFSTSWIHDCCGNQVPVPNSGRGDIRKFMSMAGGSSSQMEKQCRDQHDVIPGLRHTVWDQQDLRPKFPKIEKDESADVVVVGAGIAGISCAYNLVKEGKSVVLLEAKTRGSGMSGRTTAHLMLWYDDFYFQLEKDHGFDIAKIVAESHKRAIDFIETTVKEEGIDCHFYRLDGYLFPHDNSTEAMDLLIKEFEACKRVRLDVKMVELGNDPAYGKVGKAIQFPNSGEFHPLLYINGVADAIVRRGGRIYEKSHVFEVEKNHVKTKDGVTVTAGAVVMATYSPLNHNLAVHARQTPNRTYVIGLKVPKGSVKRANWWDTYDPYHYVRLEQKVDYDVLIVGGEDTSSGMKPKDYHDPYAQLEKWTRERWTTAEEVLYRWTGQVFEPVDHLSYWT
ncbi:uncharacterized protein LOC131039572 isoform X2 [Cryptomeria japonica]|uniref:uncharacterized protein LOC131039572 isoform X2 n=1 Tax=Cryptomeria japonica TaxID=3369 RepID=UPI0027DA5341|nr:uncharacterized protein LOC131039572 isoform X2 [Cryptomeria japonica]